MAYARIATFDVDSDSIDALLDEINASEGPPEGVPANAIAVLADRDAGKAVVITRFESEEDLRRGSETLEGMTPPSGVMRRVSVGSYEILLERSI
jgi:hypothetical protein